MYPIKWTLFRETNETGKLRPPFVFITEGENQMSTLRIIGVTTGEDRTQEYSLVNRKQAEGYKQVIEAGRYSALTKDRGREASLGTRRDGESIESLRGCRELNVLRGITNV